MYEESVILKRKVKSKCYYEKDYCCYYCEDLQKMSKRCSTGVFFIEGNMVSNFLVKKESVQKMQNVSKGEI